MAQSIRDQIRAATLGAKPQFKTKIVEYAGLEVEVKQPNLKDRRKLLEKARDEKGNFDVVLFTIWAVILNTYVPNTGEKVFSPEDAEAFMELNTGSFVETFSAAVSELMNTEETNVKP